VQHWLSNEFIEVWLWLGAVSIGLLLLVIAYGYLLVHRQRTRLWRALDERLNRRIPRVWAALKSKLSRAGHRRVGWLLVASVFALTSYFFAEITESWSEQEELHQLDQHVVIALAKTSNQDITRFLSLVTHLGSVYAAVAISCVLLGVFYTRRSRQHALALALVMGAGQTLIWGLKLVFARPRPEDSLVEAVGAAFPSGHAFTASALYPFLIYLVWGWTESTPWRVITSALLGTLALLIGVSRIVLQVHWFSDVLGGFVLGLGWLVVCLLGVRLLR